MFISKDISNGKSWDIEEWNLATFYQIVAKSRLKTYKFCDLYDLSYVDILYDQNMINPLKLNDTYFDCTKITVYIDFPFPDTETYKLQSIRDYFTQYNINITEDAEDIKIPFVIIDTMRFNSRTLYYILNNIPLIDIRVFGKLDNSSNYLQVIDPTISLLWNLSKNINDEEKF